MKRDPLSTACLLLALLPKYPVRTVEQQYHLQATRHLYVLAAEPRALHTVDVDTGLTVPVDVDITLVSGKVLRLHAPGLLPELSTIQSISVAVDPSPTKSTSSICSFSIDDSTAPSSTKYYPSTLVLKGRTGSEMERDVADFLQITRNRYLSRTHSPAEVPPLFVKQMEPPEYLTLNPLTASNDSQSTHSSSQIDNYLRQYTDQADPMVRAVAHAVVRSPLLRPVLLGGLTVS